eukprot:514865_1
MTTREDDGEEEKYLLTSQKIELEIKRSIELSIIDRNEKKEEISLLTTKSLTHDHDERKKRKKDEKEEEEEEKYSSQFTSLNKSKSNDIKEFKLNYVEFKLNEKKDAIIVNGFDEAPIDINNNNKSNKSNKICLYLKYRNDMM